MLDKIVWGIPIWIWIVFFLSRVIWVAAGGILWVYFFPRVLWNKKIQEKYFGNSGTDKQTEGSETEKR